MKIKSRKSAKIISQLISNRKLREVFSSSPEEAIKAMGIHLGKDERQVITSLKWEKAENITGKFTDKDILRCCPEIKTNFQYNQEV